MAEIFVINPLAIPQKNAMRLERFRQDKEMIFRIFVG